MPVCVCVYVCVCGGVFVCVVGMCMSTQTPDKDFRSPVAGNTGRCKMPVVGPRVL